MPNELLSYTLARQVGVRVPESVVIEVRNDTRYAGVSVDDFPPQVYFGSLFMKAASTLPPVDVSKLAEIYGGENVCLLQALDVLLKIPDRKFTDVLTLQPLGDSVHIREFIAIDFGNAFGGGHWTLDELKTNRADLAGHVSGWLFRGLTDVEGCARAAQHIAASVDCQVAIDAPLLGLGEAESNAATAFLAERVQRLEELVRADLCPGR